MFETRRCKGIKGHGRGRGRGKGRINIP